MAKKQSAQNVVDIDLSPIRKKKIRIDGDDSRILELNTSDLGILGRLKESESSITQFTKDAMKQLPDDFEELDSAISLFKDADANMRKTIDYIFDAPVSKLCAPSGTMFDPINGKFRYEYIMETLSPLYEADLTSEVEKVNLRVKKYTEKYTG